MTTLSPVFTFQGHDLVEKLRQSSAGTLTGQWRLDFQGSAFPSLYIALAQGKVVLSGSQSIGWGSFAEVLQRYVPGLRGVAGRQALQALVQEASADQLERLGAMLSKLEKQGLLNYDQVVQALRVKFLADFDGILGQSGGSATFTTDYGLVAQAPILGFELVDLMDEVTQRYATWRQLQKYIPSIHGIPILKEDALNRSSLSEAQKQQLQKLTSQHKSVGAVAALLGKDPLEVAKTFATWVKGGVVEIEGSPSLTGTTRSRQVFIVDDSPVLIRQFQALVQRLGYAVATSEDALSSIEGMLTTKPDVIFLDINMPGASGFELIKRIRRQPDLEAIPLVLLTAEKTVSNQWRAQWANCKFLAKPRTAEEQASFQMELQALLQEVAPLEKA